MLQEQIKKLQEQRIQEIIDDKNLDKISKLKFLEEEKLFDYAPYIQDEFPEWEKEIIELEKIEAERMLKEGPNNSSNPNDICYRMFYQSKMVDTIWDPSRFLYERHDLVSYIRLLESLEENDEDNFEEYYDENGNSKDGLITIMTTRHPRVVLRKSKQEIIDKLYDFCIANKIIGFKMDW